VLRFSLESALFKSKAPTLLSALSLGSNSSMRKIRLSLLLVLFCLCGQANAISGNELAQSCRGQEANSRWSFCVGYVIGVIDQARYTNDEVCIPAEAVQSQVARIATKWLESNPDKLHFLASSLVRAALDESYPCKR
jgi:hypothetical protein